MANAKQEPATTKPRKAARKKGPGRPKKATNKKPAPTAFDKQVKKVKAATLAAKKAQNKLKLETDKLKATPGAFK